MPSTRDGSKQSREEGQDPKPFAEVGKAVRLLLDKVTTLTISVGQGG